MDTEKTIALRTPIALGDLKYEKLDLREPTAGELEKSALPGLNGVGVMINLISVIAKVPRAAIEKMGQRDFEEASGFFERFNGGSPPDGATSSPT